MTTYTSTILEDPDDPESLILQFSDEMLAELGWAPGDILDWQGQDDGTVIITKKTLT
jgi:hypothetical protein